MSDQQDNQPDIDTIQVTFPDPVIDIIHMRRLVDLAIQASR